MTLLMRRREYYITYNSIRDRHLKSFVESDESFATVFVESGHFFATEQVFMCFDELKQWAYKTGLNNGYLIVTQRSKTNVASDKNKVFLRCDRGGVYKGKATVRHVGGTKKINCPFQLIAKYHKEEDGWKLKVVCGTHNHPPAVYMEGHEFAKRLNSAQKVLVKDLTNQNVDPQNIISIIRKQDPCCVSTLNQKGSGPGARSSHAITIVGDKAYAFVLDGCYK
ncbi:uncharacterized protein LOC143568764 [Bidens hawaiensis]|uniref:uncharacterized protein LOC143568764 n=1 Tax=Bidens hawaiensis TaxID=980011 RepID=UPI00404ADEE4